jgi:hypothetical protein
MPSGVILITGIVLNMPSRELKLRIRASLPEGRVQKYSKSRVNKLKILVYIYTEL